MKIEYKSKLKTIIIFCTLFVMLFNLVIPSGESYAQENKEIVFADAGWDSVKFHNSVAGLIAEKVFGYKWRQVPGASTILHEGLMNNEIDVNMEEWTDNLATYYEDLEAGKFKEVGVNFDDNKQGIYVPRYVIEGDEDLGIEAVAPDLKYVWDLKKYPELFPDSDNKDKGRIYGAIPGWETDEIIHKKYKYHNLDENFIYFRPGSEASLTAAFTSALDRGEPIAGYYWEPTWLLGKYDFVLLEDRPFDENTFKEGETELPSVEITIGASNKFAEENPEYIKFLNRYGSTSQLTSEALAYMEETGADYDETAVWFLSENDELIDDWLDEEDAELLRSSLGEETVKGTSFFKEFPFELPINMEAIDKSVRGFSLKHDSFFNGIRNGLGALVNSINAVLNFVPWIVFIALVVFFGWKGTSSIWKGTAHGAALFFIGTLGLWDLMLETLSIVLASIVISLLLGFPIGILISMSDVADSIAKPILDAMQTMPVFVYLIPALLFFGLGKPPAVIATTIYAIVPMIRLTSHGIREIDKEVVEASISYGATRMQTLIKVQIPQALPTIMTGVNQTLMMAMSMVVTTSMIGATGLGMEVLISVNRVEIGRGIISGTAVVILAILLDRITQGLIKRSEVDKNE